MSLRTTGLALGVIAAVAGSCLLAAPAQAISIPSLPDHISRFILEDTQATGGDKYIAIEKSLDGTREPTVAAAEKEADSDFFDLPQLGDEYTISEERSGDLVRSDSSLENGIGYDDGSLLDPGYFWAVDSQGVVKSDTGKYLGFDDATGRLAAVDTPRYVLAGSSTGTAATPIVAHVQSVDAAKGEALVTGTANTIAFGNKVEVAWGDSFTATDQFGEWTALVTGLQPGVSTVNFTQSVDGVKADTLPVTIDMGADAGDTFFPLEVTSGHTFPGTPVTTITGKATANATVDVTVNGVPQTTVTANAQGNWEYKRGFNNNINYTLSFTQHAGEKTDNIPTWKIGPATS